MNTSDLKLKIFRQLDSLEKSKIEELYGVLLNYINGLKGINDWDKLTDYQKQGISDAINEIDAGKGISHKKIIAKYRKKYSHA
jgi:hypothetical protein